MEAQLDALRARFVEVRSFSEKMCEPLRTEDYVVQSMPEASPAKWHLAHTTWFFDKFILQELCGRAPFDERFDIVFNSYYNAVGQPHPRPRRGMITRPGVDEVYDYRSAIDEQLQEVLAGGDRGGEFLSRLQVGLHHEQQHQELLLTDLKHLMWQNPLRPAPFDFDHAPFDADDKPAPDSSLEPRRTPRETFDSGVYEVGHHGRGFSFDNERPRHEVLLQPFELARRPVTCSEYLQFMGDGGYESPQLWLADGWEKVRSEGWDSPLYWERRDGRWHQYTLSGLRPVQPDEPVVHISLYEAQAFARWAGARLPTEQEWEVVARRGDVEGNFVESGRFHPQAAEPGSRGPTQLFGDVWEWTASSYAPYPGFEPFDGSLQEYNGKFMCSQYVLRGGSCATSRSHIRATYRNFFYPQARWQFSGVRLAW